MIMSIKSPINKLQGLLAIGSGGFIWQGCAWD